MRRYEVTVLVPNNMPSLHLDSCVPPCTRMSALQCSDSSQLARQALQSTTGCTCTVDTAARCSACELTHRTRASFHLLAHVFRLHTTRSRVSSPPAQTQTTSTSRHLSVSELSSLDRVHTSVASLTPSTHTYIQRLPATRKQVVRNYDVLVLPRHEQYGVTLRSQFL